eukprot:GFKZ01008048.1.p1 GENE.GFKZ01008048.1~~GFKZ01008048.1.p1  ORF type:complete len:221 (+),score=19.09 GFKZ01008048.1:144-806(+)
MRIPASQRRRKPNICNRMTSPHKPHRKAATPGTGGVPRRKRRTHHKNTPRLAIDALQLLPTIKRPAELVARPYAEYHARFIIALSSRKLKRWCDRLVELINVSRMKGGQNPVRRSRTLDKVARVHTEDQARMRKGCTHGGSDGMQVQRRARRAGYRYEVIGENVASGFFSPLVVHVGFMTSEGHAANVMDGGFEEVGVHVCRSVYGNLYWTEVFGSRRRA